MNLSLFRKTIFCVCVTMMYATIVYAGNPNRKGTGAAAGLYIPIGARAISLSGAVSADAVGLEATFYNPAGLSASTRKAEVMFSRTNYLADIGIQYFGGALKMSSLGWIGVSIKSINIGQIQRTTIDDPDGLNGQTYTPTLFDIGLTFSRMMTDRILFGFTAKVVSERISDAAATGFAFDVGLQYKTQLGVNFGLVVKNLGGDLRYGGTELERKTVDPQADPLDGKQFNYALTAEAYPIPSTVELSVNYSRKLAERNNISVMGTFLNNNFSDDEVKFGLEYAYDNLFFARGGYSIPTGNSDDYIYGLNLGAGINYNVGTLNLQIDYAYQSTRFFSGNQVFTVKLGL